MDHLGQAVLRGDREALGLAVVIAVGLVLLRRGTGTLGAVFLSLVFGDFLVWTMWAAMNSLRHGEQPEDVTLPAVLAVLRYPFSYWMRCHPKHVDSAGTHLDHKQHVQPLKKRCPR